MRSSRLDLLRSRLSALRLDALIVSSLADIRYLTGFTGSHALVGVTLRRAGIITDGRYRHQVHVEAVGWEAVVAAEGLPDGLKRSGLLARARRIGFDDQNLSVAGLRTLRSLFPHRKFVPAGGVVERLAAVKSEQEIAYIRRAAEISDRVFSRILKLIRPGVRELELAAEISHLHRSLGAEADAFEPIVAGGPRGAFPHARATDQALRSGTLLTLDFGCRVCGYHSDLTRTVAVGRISRTLRAMYDAVREAQEAAVECLRPGMAARQLDAAAREQLRRRGYGRYFVHSLGHGLGLRVHELPRVSAVSSDVLQAGNVITIEPGIYLPRIGGVRMEDDIVVREDGPEVLTHAPRELVVL